MAKSYGNGSEEYDPAFELPEEFAQTLYGLLQDYHALPEDAVVDYEDFKARVNQMIESNLSSTAITMQTDELRGREPDHVLIDQEGRLHPKWDQEFTYFVPEEERDRYQERFEELLQDWVENNGGTVERPWGMLEQTDNGIELYATE